MPSVCMSLCERGRGRPEPGASDRTIEDDAATFDVQPTAPGGSALRSHLPLVARHDGRRSVAGVLAVAHQHRLDPDSRRVLERLADTAAALLGRPAQRGSDESG